MVHVEEWLKTSNTTLEQADELFAIIIKKTIIPEIENNLKTLIDRINKEFIPEGKKLRDSWKERTHGKTAYEDIKKMLAKLRLAVQGLQAVRILYQQLKKQCPEFDLKCTDIH